MANVSVIVITSCQLAYLPILERRYHMGCTNHIHVNSTAHWDAAQPYLC